MSLRENAFDHIARLIAEGADVTAGMKQMLEECAQWLPNPVRNRVRDLEFKRDVNRLKHWLSELLIEEPPPQSINALWFGLFNPVSSSGETTCGLYLAGSARFDEKANTLDWAVGPEYWPQRRCANSQALSELYRLSKDVNGAEYALCLAYAALVTAEIAGSIDVELLLGGTSQRAVVTGFDDGDFLLVGTIRNSGFIRTPRQIP